MGHGKCADDPSCRSRVCAYRTSPFGSFSKKSAAFSDRLRFDQCRGQAAVVLDFDHAEQNISTAPYLMAGCGGARVAWCKTAKLARKRACFELFYVAARGGCQQLMRPGLCTLVCGFRRTKLSATRCRGTSGSAAWRTCSGCVVVRRVLDGCSC